jgi:glucose/arabinose dehydrogenase
MDPALEVEVIATGLEAPTSMAFLGAGDFLVLQKNNGLVLRFAPGIAEPTIVLDVAVHSRSERGLLGIASSPDFINDRHVYLYYTESATGSDTSSQSSDPAGNRVYRYTWDGTALVDPRLVFDLPATPGPNHDGGVLVFGPDDALYVVIGDLNRDGKLQNFPEGPDPDDTGVILRIDPAGRPLRDNPFFDPLDPGNLLARVYAYGVHNSFGLAFDPISGDLWDTENGPNSFDEVNRVIPGFNSGWQPIMGPVERDAQTVDDLWAAPGSHYRDPDFSWLNPVAPTALTFAASPVLGCGLLHDLVVGDNNCGQLYRFRPNAARDGLEFASPDLQDHVADNAGAICSREQAEILFGGGWGIVTDLENGPDGSLYVVSLAPGAVFRVGPRAGAFTDADGDGVDDACDCDPADDGSFGAPTEVRRLRPSGNSPMVFGWDSQSATAGPATTYTLASGDLETLLTERGYASACTLLEGLALPQAIETRSDPPAGMADYYLVKATNGCDSGTYGDASPAEDPRDDLDLAFLPPCP